MPLWPKSELAEATRSWGHASLEPVGVVERLGRQKSVEVILAQRGRPKPFLSTAPAHGALQAPTPQPGTSHFRVRYVQTRLEQGKRSRTRP
eukprot:9490719-Pyramimonas_sp.AAC.1